MLLFKKKFHEGLKSGAVTVTFRRWDKPHVKVGGRYRCHPIGVLQVDVVEQVKLKDIVESDIVASGFETRKELVEYIATAREEALTKDTLLYRVVLHHGGDGDRIGLALEDDLTEADIETIAKKLTKLDANATKAKTKGAAWTKQTLTLIEENPRIAASKLALKVGRETEPFKVDVRKLKKLGLTQSFEVGYEISPRGKAFLASKKTW